MKRFPLYALLLCLFLTTFAYGNITIDGDSVHVETDRYAVEFYKTFGASLESKLCNR